MKKTHWLLLGIGSILLWGGMVLCLLIVLQFGSESFSQEELVDASEEAYRFDPQTILTEDTKRVNVFTKIPFTEKFPEPVFNTIFWEQDDYFSVMDSFMYYVLSEDRNAWKLIEISSVNLCPGLTGLSMLTIRMQKRFSLSDESYRANIHVNIMPQSGIVELLQRKYAPDEGGERTLRWDEIKITAEQALLIAEENGGTIVREALGNQCRIIISLKAGIQKNDWWIYYEPINEPSVFEIAVDEQTGKHRILREFQR